jgi:hypothetical protein
MPAPIVDHLRINVLDTPENRQSWPLFGSLHPLADALVNAHAHNIF